MWTIAGLLKGKKGIYSWEGRSFQVILVFSWGGGGEQEQVPWDSTWIRAEIICLMQRFKDNHILVQRSLALQMLCFWAMPWTARLLQWAPRGKWRPGRVYRPYTQALEMSVSSGYSRDTCAKENTKCRLSSAAKDSQWKTRRMRSRGPKVLSEFHLEGNPELTSRHGPSHRP